jgi:SpoVK/Ycf46/Vps4 family AAA+-type ATPase
VAAQTLAGGLDLDLFRIDLPQTVAKYIGETERKMDQVLAAAEAGNSALLLGEGDAVFGKRSEGRDSHDRCAKGEVSYLLQRMEERRGTVIPGANLRENLDDTYRAAIEAHACLCETRPSRTHTLLGQHASPRGWAIAGCGRRSR